MPFPRLIEARALILHGLGENIAQNEAYMQELRQMMNQCERVYWQTMRDRGLPFPAAPPILAIPYLSWWKRLRWAFSSSDAVPMMRNPSA